MQKKQGKKILRKSATHSSDDLKRYLGSLSEDFQSKVTAIGEQYFGLHKDIKLTHLTLGKLVEDVNEIRVDMSIIKSDIAFIKGGLKKKVDYDEFQVLTKRVALLEHRVRR